MKMLFKQRVFSWFDSYDIYDEAGNVLYEVKGELSWGHCLKIYDAQGQEVATVKEKIFTFMPEFEIYIGDALVGSITKEFTFFTSNYDIDFNGWHVKGDFMEWDYSITDPTGMEVATITKELFHWSDTYIVDVADPADSLAALALVLAIDAEKCSRN